jgi:glycosyltransferase involved in cell wall biosynthesis
LLFVGRLETRKGIDVVFEAARRVLPRHPSATLDIVGNDTIPGPTGMTYRASFETDDANALIRHQVRFHGAVGEPELRGFLASSDVLLAPSRFESFGLVLLEGMMFGKPVVGCRAGGMPEVVGDEEAGLLAEPGDPVSLASCIDRLLSDSALRTRLGQAARLRYERDFSPQVMASSVRAIMLRASS